MHVQETDGEEKNDSTDAVSHRKTHHSLLQALKRRYAPVLLEAAPLLLIIGVPLYVHAGVFSSMADAIGNSVITYEATEEKILPSELRLLSSRTNPDPNAALGGGDILVDEDSLVSGGAFGDDAYSEDYASGEISVYVVREGDSLSQIADMFDVTANTILWANNLENPTIHEGQTLVILPIIGVRHVIKEGDTIASIAKKYGGDEGEILSYNRLGSVNDIIVGETLIVPGGNLHTTPPKQAVKSSSPAKSSGDASDGGGYFSHPVPGAVRTQGVHGYNAVDLAAAAGTAIRAAASGEVIVSRASGWNGGYGTYVVIKHANGTQTLYAHNSSNAVGVGAYVNAGDTIGYVGTTGKSTGAHVHFEVRGASNPF